MYKYFDLDGYGKCIVKTVTRLGEDEIYSLLSPENEKLYLVKNHESLTLYVTSK